MERLVSVPCNLCGVDHTDQLMQIQGLNIVKCRDCGLIYVNPRPEDVDLSEIYTDRYYQNTDGFQDLDPPALFGYENYLADANNIERTFARRLEVLEQYVEVGSLLDVGCAFGLCLQVAKSRGWSPYGLEVSQYSSRFARDLGFDVYRCELREAKFPAASYHAITCWDVIEHMADPMAELAEMNRLLVDRGILSLVTPDAGSLVARFLGRNWEEYRRVREHLYFLTQQTVTTMLVRSGFEVVHVESAGKYFDLLSLANRVTVYTNGLGKLGPLTWLLSKTRLGNVVMYVNPLTKFNIYARKVG